jgi:hypothetical protein
MFRMFTVDVGTDGEFEGCRKSYGVKIFRMLRVDVGTGVGREPMALRHNCNAAKNSMLSNRSGLVLCDVGVGRCPLLEMRLLLVLVVDWKAVEDWMALKCIECLMLLLTQVLAREPMAVLGNRNAAKHWLVAESVPLVCHAHYSENPLLSELAQHSVQSLGTE